MTRIIADKHTSNTAQNQTRHDKTIQGKIFRKEGRKIGTCHLILSERSLVLKMWDHEMPGAL
jgi:hypothetical protein